MQLWDADLEFRRSLRLRRARRRPLGRNRRRPWAGSIRRATGRRIPEPTPTVACPMILSMRLRTSPGSVPEPVDRRFGAVYPSWASFSQTYVSFLVFCDGSHALPRTITLVGTGQRNDARSHLHRSMISLSGSGVGIHMEPRNVKVLAGCRFRISFFSCCEFLLKNAKLRQSGPAQFKTAARNRLDWPKVPLQSRAAAALFGGDYNSSEIRLPDRLH
jgi:hypothetical protein